ncbi:MAG: PAS domain-containing protein [Syntrophaceae bacterium]|nr:PAS domain-containing protein [Syntrophaceae bacterium]
MPARGPEKKTVRKKKDGELHCDPASRKRRGTQSAAGRAGRTSKAAAAPPGDAGALYTSLFRDSHTIMLLIDPRDGRIVDANRAAVRFYGYPARTLKSMRIGDVNLLDEGPLRENMGQAERKERRQFHFRHRLAMGRFATSRSTAVPYGSGAERFSIPSLRTSRSACTRRRRCGRSAISARPCWTRPARWWSSLTGRAGSRDSTGPARP